MVTTIVKPGEGGPLLEIVVSFGGIMAMACDKYNCTAISSDEGKMWVERVSICRCVEVG